MFQIRGLGEDWSTMEADEAPMGEDRPAAAVYCAKKFGTTSPNFQPCVDFYAGPHIGEYVPSSASPGTVVKTPSSSMVSFFKNTKATTASSTVPPGTITSTPSVFNVISPSGIPWYKTPLGIGGIIVGLFLIGRQYQKRRAA